MPIAALQATGGLADQVYPFFWVIEIYLLLCWISICLTEASNEGL